MNNNQAKNSGMKYLSRCSDHCEMFLQYSSNMIHYGSLRCKKHGFIKWLSYEQYGELDRIMYPEHYQKIGIHINDYLK